MSDFLTDPMPYLLIALMVGFFAERALVLISVLLRWWFKVGPEFEE